MTLEDLFPLYGHLPRITDADVVALARAIDRRRLDEVHDCVFCGERARVALAAGASDLFGPAQWLDLCPPCDRELRIMLDELGRFAFDSQDLDAEIIRRYEEWMTAGDARNPA